MLTIGSTAITKPGSIRKSPLPRSAAEEIGDLGILVHLPADPVPHEALDGRKPVIGDILGHLVGDLRSSSS